MVLVSYTFPVYAGDIGSGLPCNPKVDTCTTRGESCLPNHTSSGLYPPGTWPNLCQPDVFGKIQPPDALKAFIGTDPTGAAGISKFLTNLIALFYSVAAIVLIFMILWGGFDWLTSEGDKEKLEGARKKIINAVIGIMLFGIAFAIIQVLGIFTGFKFFERTTNTITCTPPLKLNPATNKCEP